VFYTPYVDLPAGFLQSKEGLMHNGYTQKYCYTCGKYTSHSIQNTDGLKAYICIAHVNHGLTIREMQQQAAERMDL
jgi:hypothetical protein